MYFSSKDKSFLLFIGAALVVLWIAISAFSFVFDKVSFRFSSLHKIAQSQEKWFNVNEKIGIEDLKGRVILLHFWDRACISCIEALPTIKKLEERFGNKLTVIGIYAAKFEGGKSDDEIRSAVIKYDINHAVIKDSALKLSTEFAVKGSPTFVIIKPNGRKYEKYEGISALEKMENDVKKLVKKHRFDVNRKPLPILPEKFSKIANVLSFPSKLEYSGNLVLNSRNISAIFIANSGQNNIVTSSLLGTILLKIGSGREGFVDGDFFTAEFRNPQSVLFDDQKLYIADTGNHAIRVADFRTNKVSTLIGSGRKGGVVKAEIAAKNFNLASPTDLEFFADKKQIIISNAGTNQILSYDISNQKIKALAGNGESKNKDGIFPNNSLTQTADMVVVKDKIYFVDALSSTLRSLDKSGNVKTLVENGLQNPVGLTGEGDAIYIADSFNNRIAKYSISAQKLSNFAGSKAGDLVGKKTEFNSPEAILKINNYFYISDANNNRIVLMNAKNLSSEILDVIPPLKLPREGFLEYLPNLQKSADVNVKSGEIITLRIEMNEGWRINEEAPSFINLLKMQNSEKADLIASFDWHFVRQREIKLPKLESGEDYILQGSIYYCEDKKNSLCYVKSYEQKIIAVSDVKDVEVVVKLGY